MTDPVLLSRIKRKPEPANQFTYGRGLENDGVLAGIEFFSIDRSQAFFYRYRRLFSAIQTVERH